ncbi:seryl-tRNA synthetase [Massospora cicadina]|nr:seryl-tRNA synthetase [Massospora cicadina]
MEPRSIPLPFSIVADLLPLGKLNLNAPFPRYDIRTIVGKPHFDFKALEARKAEMQNNIRDRKLGADITLDEVLARHRDYKQLQRELNQMRNGQSELSRKFATCQTAEGRERVKAEAQAAKAQLKLKEELVSEAEELTLKLCSAIPNFTHPDTPIGGEEQAKVLKVVNERGYMEGCKPHLELCLAHRMANFSSAAQVAGAKFYYLENDGAMLELALTQLAMAKAREAGFTPTLTPDIVREDVVAACGFNPRDSAHNQTFKVSSGGHLNLCLAATSEIPLAAYHIDRILDRQTLPSRKAGLSHCFRAEAGSTGADCKGLYRVHQFTKVELFAFTAPEDSERVFGEIVAFQESFFGSLGLHYRVVNMPTAELGASAYQKYDLEAWLPGQNRWGSASNCTDYQSRRLNVRLRKDNKAGTVEFVHTVNGTACAIPRTIVAILEQFQDARGRVAIPDILRPYFDNREFFEGPLTE